MGCDKKPIKKFFFMKLPHFSQKKYVTRIIIISNQNLFSYSVNHHPSSNNQSNQIKSNFKSPNLFGPLDEDRIVAIDQSLNEKLDVYTNLIGQLEKQLDLKNKMVNKYYPIKLIRKFNFCFEIGHHQTHTHTHTIFWILFLI